MCANKASGLFWAGVQIWTRWIRAHRPPLAPRIDTGLNGSCTACHAAVPAGQFDESCGQAVYGRADKAVKSLSRACKAHSPLHAALCTTAHHTPWTWDDTAAYHAAHRTTESREAREGFPKTSQASVRSPVPQVSFLINTPRREINYRGALAPAGHRRPPAGRPPPLSS